MKITTSLWDFVLRICNKKTDGITSYGNVCVLPANQIPIIMTFELSKHRFHLYLADENTFLQLITAGINVDEFILIDHINGNNGYTIIIYSDTMDDITANSLFIHARNPSNILILSVMEFICAYRGYSIGKRF